MKKIYFLLITVLAVTVTWSQTTYTWKGVNDASWQVASNWLPLRNAPATNDILLFNEGNTRNITSFPTSQTVGRIAISNNTSITLKSVPGIQTLRIGNGAVAAGDEFVVESGSSFIQDISLNEIILQANATANIAGNYTIQSLEGFFFTNNTSIATVTGTLINQGVISNASTARLIFTGGKYIHAINGGDVPFASWNSASTCEITGVTNNEPNNLDQAFGHFTWNCAGQANNQQLQLPGSGMLVAGDFTVSSTGNDVNNRIELNQSPLAIGRDLILTGGTLRIGSNTARTLNVTRDALISGGILLMSSGNNVGTLNVTRNFNQSGGTITETNTGNGAINFNGTSVQAFSKAVAATISNTINFTINNNAKVDFGTSTLNGSTGTFTLTSGGKIITANANGLSATGSIQVTGAKSYSSTADYEFQGGSTGVFTTTTDPQVRNFTVNNTATSNVVLSKAMTVNGALALTNGYLTTTTNLLTIGTTGTASTTNGAFVNGPLAKMTNSILATPFMFPVGKVAGGLREIGIITTAVTASTFTAQFFRGAPAAAPLGAGITQKSICESWDLARPSGSPAQVVLSWSGASPCGSSSSYVSDLSTLRVAHLTGGTWVNEGRQSSTGNNTAGTVTSLNAVSTFSPFALASSSSATNPLPVVFANVKAYEKNNGVQIEWSNLTEKDVAEYSIERSANGKDFSTIVQQLPAGNQNDKADYSAFDALPNAGINYYRIKSEETTGKIVYSKVLSVNIGKTNQALRLYPNPVSGNQITFSLSNVKRGMYSLRVINIAGQDVYKQTLTNHGNSLTQSMDLPASVKPGVYNMIVTGVDFRESKMFIIR